MREWSHSGGSSVLRVCVGDQDRPMTNVMSVRACVCVRVCVWTATAGREQQEAVSALALRSVTGVCSTYAALCNRFGE